MESVVFRKLFMVNSSFCGGLGLEAGGGMMCDVMGVCVTLRERRRTEKQGLEQMKREVVSVRS